MTVESSLGPRAEPVRTCVGCRARAAKSALLRVVAVDDRLVVDRRGRLPGRGAHLHPDLACLELAERRKAFPRALRRVGPWDLTPIREALDAMPIDASGVVSTSE